jgi:hypothetical protein
LGGVVHGEAGKIECWQLSSDGGLGSHEVFLRDWGISSGGDGQPVGIHHVSSEHVRASVHDTPVIVVGGKDINWVFLVAVSHGGEAGSLIIGSTFGHLSSDSGILTKHHPELGSEVKVVVTSTVSSVDLGSTFLSHFEGEELVSLLLKPLTLVSGHVEVWLRSNLWAGSESHSGVNGGDGSHGHKCSFHVWLVFNLL